MGAHNKKLIKKIKKHIHLKKRVIHHKKKLTHHVSKKVHKKVIAHITKSISKKIVKNNVKIAKLQSVIKHSKDQHSIAKAKKSMKALKTVSLTLKVTRQAVKGPAQVLQKSKSILKKQVLQLRTTTHLYIQIKITITIIIKTIIIQKEIIK